MPAWGGRARRRRCPRTSRVRELRGLCRTLEQWMVRTCDPMLDVFRQRATPRPGKRTWRLSRRKPKRAERAAAAKRHWTYRPPCRATSSVSPRSSAKILTSPQHLQSDPSRCSDWPRSGRGGSSPAHALRPRFARVSDPAATADRRSPAGPALGAGLRPRRSADRRSPAGSETAGPPPWLGRRLAIAPANPLDSASAFSYHFERVDRFVVFHTEWLEQRRPPKI